MSHLVIWHYSRDNNGYINLAADPLEPITEPFDVNRSVKELIYDWLSVFEERDNVGYVGDRDDYQLVAILNDDLYPEYELATPNHSFKRFFDEVAICAQKLMIEDGEDKSWVDVSFALVQKWED